MKEANNFQLSIINSPLIPPGYKQTAVGVIPKDWDSTTVRAIASPVRNAIVGGPFGSDLVSNDYVENGVPVIRGQNMGFRYVSGSFVFVSPTKANSLEANLARPGDLLFTQRGTLGQVSLVADQPFDRYLVSQSQMKLTVNHKTADPLFFLYVFSSAEQQELIRQNTIQTGVPHINLGILRAIPVQRPPLAEQEAIAEALSDADALIESLEQLLTKKRQIKQGAMQWLLTPPVSSQVDNGKLKIDSEENSPFSTIHSPLNKRLPGFSGEWEVIALGQMGKCHRGVSYNPNADLSPFDTDSTVRLLRSNNVQEAKVVFTDMQYVDSGRVSDDQRLRTNDILICMANGSRALVGKSGRFTADDGFKYTFGAFMGCFRPNGQTANPDFVFYLFQTEKYRAHIAILLAGSSINNLTPGSVEALVIRVPSDKAEQTAIAAILSDMDAEIAALETKLTKTRQLKQGMMQELLTGRIRLI